MFGLRSGSVVEFDEASGLGSVQEPSGQRWPFHCVSILDGTRNIPVGARVGFEVAPRVGRLEAVSIRPAHQN